LITYEPDIVTRGLDVVFCGLNPAASAAAAGHNFSSRSNRFWKVLHRAGFTDVPLQAHEERRLLDYGCGITAVVGRPTQRADEVSLEKFKSGPSRIQSQDSAPCPALDRPSQQARRVGDARCSRRSLHRISDNALRRRPGTNALSDVTVRAVRWQPFRSTP
jgi:G:T/U-mismatch repair DNA glycosylase